MNSSHPAGGDSIAVRRGPLGPLENVRSAVTVVLTNLTPPPREVVDRWRRTGVYGACWVLFVVALIWFGVPWYASMPLAWLGFAVLWTGTFSAEQRRVGSDLEVWRGWSGAAGAVCSVQWNPRRQRHEIHSWAAFPRGRGLGTPVLRTAIAQAPRPLWLRPATPELRSKYRGHGFRDVPSTPWMKLDQ